MNQVQEPHAAGKSSMEKRQDGRPRPELILVELDPVTILQGVRLDDGFVVEDLHTQGEMREFCPHCEGIHLRLVLRQRNVKAAHLFCDHCTRCFDARFTDGSSALSIA